MNYINKPFKKEKLLIIWIIGFCMFGCIGILFQSPKTDVLVTGVTNFLFSSIGGLIGYLTGKFNAQPQYENSPINNNENPSE